MGKNWLLVIVCGLSCSLYGQLPKSNLYAFDIKTEKDSLSLSDPSYLTFFNNDGYNNHPHFINNDELMLSSKLNYEDQPDIYALNLKTKRRTRVTATPEGEYSPALTPDFYNFSAIRMEFYQQDTILRLWQFPIDRSGVGRPVFKDIINVGYYCWLNSRDIMLYLVEQPSQLVQADIYSGQQEVVATNIGRCFKSIGNGKVLYLQKSTTEDPMLMIYNARSRARSGKKQELINAVDNAEDFAVYYDGSIFMASGSEIYRFRPGQDQEWMLLTDLRAYDINNISRMTFSNDFKRIVLVAN